MKAPILIHLSLAITAWCAEPEFHNRGTLDGFTGGNQRTKLSVSTAQDADGNGTSILCLMLRAEPDVPGGCHAETHLARLPDGSRLGAHPGFASTTVYRVYFDPDCNAASVGFFQYKNNEGPERWKYLVAMWRMPFTDGSEIHFQVNPNGRSAYHYAALDGATRLTAGRWHEVRVTGHFTKDRDGWAEISINGQPVTWFRDQARKQPVGHRITGAFLPDLPKSEWQLQLGGYGFFKDRDTRQAIVFIDDVWVSRSVPEPIPSTKP
jgi:hypothetical protein